MHGLEGASTVGNADIPCRILRAHQGLIFGRVAQRPVMLTAKILSSMDVVSNGRVLAGVGGGWLRKEFDITETPPLQDRGNVADELIWAMKRPWIPNGLAIS